MNTFEYSPEEEFAFLFPYSPQQNPLLPQFNLLCDTNYFAASRKKIPNLKITNDKLI